jgi:biopolymer transport protein ExbB
MSAFWTFVTHDWYFAFPMFIMSFSGLTLVIWRILLNSNGNTVMNEFLPVFQQKLEKEGVEGALKFCRSRQDIIPRRLFVAGLETSKQGLAAVRRSMANVIELEILPDLNFLLAPILAIAKIATMVGLLGTVLSMIGTFNEIQKAKGGGDVGAQAGAIGLALFATALGLVTAIPLVFSHVLFKDWVAKFEVRMKSAAQKLILLLQAKPPAKGPAAPGGTTVPTTASQVKQSADAQASTAAQRR